MAKINNLVAGVAMLWAVASTQAQQVVKRITHNTNNTVVELFALRNGTSLPNTTGERNFNTGTSDNKGTVIVYNPAFANTYDNQKLPSWFTPYGTEQIGNGTFPFDWNQASTLNNTNFIANGGLWTTLNMTIPQENGNADNTQDNNTLSDMMYSKFTLPKTLNDGSPLPAGLIVICASRSWTDINTWANSNPTKRLGFQRNQKDLSWKSIDTSRTWSSFDNLQEIGTDGQMLWTDDFEITKTAETVLYPNPAHSFIALDNHNDIPSETLDVEIYDTTGRQVIGRSSYKEGELLDISMLANGHYFVKSTSDDKKTTTKKLIKN